jgi:hypothetical protein
VISQLPMPRDFPDELLSAYLDGELTPSERAQVEEHLQSCAADRQLLEELRALRRDVAALPRASVSHSFSERVIQAAVSRSRVAPPVAAKPSSSRRRLVVAAIALGLAACLLVVIRLRPLVTPVRNDPATLGAGQPPLAGAERLLAPLHVSLPDENEALVLRLRIPKHVSPAELLDVALHASGIQDRPTSDATTGAMALGRAYHEQLLRRVGADAGQESTALAAATVPAADALYIEAPLAQLEAALQALAAMELRSMELAAEARLAWERATPFQPQGEGASGATQRFPEGQPFAQRLNAGLFRLANGPAPLAPAANPTTIGKSSRYRVRVLILVEQIDAP